MLWKSKCHLLVIFLSHLKRKNVLKTEISVLWIFSLDSSHEKTPQNNFSSHNFSVEDNQVIPNPSIDLRLFVIELRVIKKEYKKTRKEARRRW